MLQPNSGPVLRVAQCLLFLAGLVTIADLGGDVLVAQPTAAGKTQVDAHGDPLPPGALARLGTLRWRQSDAVTQVEFLPDGTTVVTGSPQDRTIRLWERATGKEIRRFRAGRPGRREGGAAGAEPGPAAGVGLAGDGAVEGRHNVGRRRRQ